MAEQILRAKRGRYYVPADVIRDVPGLCKRARYMREDEYVGTAEQIVASGLLMHSQLPGSPGVPATCVTYRPAGSEGGNRFNFLPGYLRAYRLLDGRYRVLLVVAEEECARRQKGVDDLDRAAEAAAAAVLDELSPRLRTYIKEFLDAHGRFTTQATFSDQVWLTKHGIRPGVATQILAGLALFDQAEVERELVRRPMAEAKEVLQRFALG